jgi:hypothetical protein
MYCPNCGQQQISDEMRFCSRCGLAFSGLTEWLASGRLPAPKADAEEVAMDSPRRKGMRRGAKLMFFSLVLFFVCLAISIGIDEGAVMLFPCTLFFISLVWILYARLFSAKTAPANPPIFQPPIVQTPAFGSNPARPSLSNAANVPIQPIGRHQVRTNELAQPGSVTENTTKLLDE